MAKLNLVIFDCDGTLVVSEEANNKVISDALKNIGFANYKPEICLQKFRGLDSKQIIKILDKENNDFDVEIFKKSIEQTSMSFMSEIKAVKNADLVLNKLTLNKCVVSNGVRQNVISSLEQNDLLKFFHKENIITCLESENAKPAPDMFFRAAKNFSCAVDQVLVIEDSEAGIEAAKAAGMRAVGFTGTAIIKERRKSKLLASGADYIIDDLSEILDITHFC